MSPEWCTFWLWFNLPDPAVEEALYELKPSALVRDILQVLLDITNLRLNFAEVLLNVAFGFQRLVAYELAGSLLDGSFRLFDAALNLVFIDCCHYLLLISDTGKRPARATQKLVSSFQNRRDVPVTRRRSADPGPLRAALMFVPTEAGI
jgi:hypothetical protein